MSPDEFHRLYDGAKPNYEYWFGEAIQKPRATKLHSAVQFVIMMLLSARGWNLFPELTLELVPDAAPIPDVVATRKREKREPYQTTPPNLCIEILSPRDRIKRTIEKGKYYLSWDVATVWIIDPLRRMAWIMTNDHPDGIPVSADGDLVAGDTGIALAELFAEVDKKLA